MRIAVILLVSLSVTNITLVNCLPNGAPNQACSTFTPEHEDILAQTGSAPYKITTSENVINSGDSITVTVSGMTSSTKFKGFLMVARKPGTSTNLGQFTATGKTKSKACESSKDSVTHKDNTDKSSVVVTWTAPESFTGKVVFSATIVKDFENFYKNVKSSQVTVQ